MLDSHAAAVVLLRNDPLGWLSKGDFVFVLIALVGILSLLLVVLASVTYLALPRGRLCPHCGGSTNPVVLSGLLRILSRWIQWRWCARCSWEGPGLRGADLGALDPPADRRAGYRLPDPDPDPDLAEAGGGAMDRDVLSVDDIQEFHWQSGPEEERREAPSDHPSGFKWQGEEESTEAEEQAPPKQAGFYFRPPGERRRSPFQWGPTLNQGRRSGDDRRGRKPRPWYLSWLVSKETPGFQWKQQGD